jgi:ribosomal protein S18 acetylase RimI-like enzyme
MTVRRLGPDDWADWRRMRIRALTENPEAFAGSVTLWTGSRDAEANWRARIAQPGACFLAYLDGAPVGMVGCRRDADGPELVSMWVAPEARRRGIGGQLIDAVIGWADDGALRLRVIDGNDAAIGVYRSRGFILSSECPDKEHCRTMNRS